ncbi:CobW family GTP-binding protein [Marinimicrobium sp. C2-29]|uniref:CobW family GTP-binding protein n=1 Tax=Marinimicrobium sp. C2-29 TaxID=3139825 RepID=UPI00313A2AEB
MSESSNSTPKSVPTNILTGFLGVGKTTAIQHLLRTKPKDETWAVLVNEFGEVGIDGALLRDGGARVREVPGGCICCVAGLPMTVALNQLLGRERPDRLLIEPTGLGHPAQIIDTLTGPFYQAVLDLRATVTLIDPRKLADERYTENTNFRDQIAVADVLIANKADLCAPEDWQRFARLEADAEPPKARVERVEQGQIDPAWLDYPRLERPLHDRHFHREPRLQAPPVAQLMALPEGEPMVRRENRGQDYYSSGWVFTPDWEFDFNGLFNWLNGVTAERVKAVMITDEGIFSFNISEQVVTVNELDETPDSRIELIDPAPIEAEQIEQELRALVVNA